MSRLLDATICPDCRGPLDAAATCTACGLRLSGPLAVRLWGAMVTADGLVEQLRISPARNPVAGPAASPEAHPDAGPETGPETGPVGIVGARGDVGGRPSPGASLPSFPLAPTGPPPAHTPRRLPSASVPVVLLSLGALCLLVAAIVFIVVNWSRLGLTGRTLVLLGLTTSVAAVAVVLTGKGLRGAAETFWLVVAGMLTIDLLAATSAGLLRLDELNWRATSALVGGVLLGMGVGVGAWARRQPVARLYGVQCVAVLGAAVVTVTNAWVAESAALATSIATLLLAAGCVLLHRPVPVAAYGLGALGGLSWLVLLGLGVGRAIDSSGIAAWWRELNGWPFLVAAFLAASAVHLPGVHDRVRPVGAALALLPLALLVNAPLDEGQPTRHLLLAAATVLLLGLLSAFAPKAWAQGAAALTGTGIVVLGSLLALTPWGVLANLAPDGSAAVTMTLSAPRGEAVSWSYLVTALAIVAASVCLLRHVVAAHRPPVRRLVTTVAPAVVGLGALVLVLLAAPPLWGVVLGAGAATAVAGAAAWWSREHVHAAAAGSAGTAYLALLLLVAASASHLLVALTTTLGFVALAAAAGSRERTWGGTTAAVSASFSASLLATLAASAGGWALIGWCLVAETDLATRTVALALYAGLVGVLAAPLTRRTATRLCLEAASGVLALLALAATSEDHSAAMVLTVAGTSICLVAVSTRDRALLGWAGAAVLGTATLIRVAADIGAPEIYTLPAALVLVGVGAWRLHTIPGSNSFTMLGSGVTLGLLPSLLLSLDEPVSLRGAILGAASVLVLAAGVQQRLAAPFVLGALTTGVLALRHLGPVAEAVPRWISLGGVGVVLLLVGVTWEARRGDLARAHRYLTDLR